jgi:hypothetical protein
MQHLAYGCCEINCCEVFQRQTGDSFESLGPADAKAEEEDRSLPLEQPWGVVDAVEEEQQLVRHGPFDAS